MDVLQAELPALLKTLHAGGATTINISHHVDAHGGCQFTIEVVRPSSDEPWEYRWP